MNQNEKTRNDRIWAVKLAVKNVCGIRDDNFCTDNSKCGNKCCYSNSIKLCLKPVFIVNFINKNLNLGSAMAV